MNYAQIRRKTRRLVQERTANDWDETLDVGRAVNNKLIAAQNRLEYIRPGTHATFAALNITSGTARYPRPAYVPVLYYLLDGAGASTYTQCNSLSVEQTQKSADGRLSRIDAPEENTVVEDDNEIIIYPTPTFTTVASAPLMVGAGLKVRLDPSITLVADADVPRLRAELHVRIAYGAAGELLDEDPNSDPKFRAYCHSMFDEFFGPTPEALQRLARVYPLKAPTTMLIERPIIEDPSGRWRGCQCL